MKTQKEKRALLRGSRWLSARVVHETESSNICRQCCVRAKNGLPEASGTFICVNLRRVSVAATAAPADERRGRTSNTKKQRLCSSRAIHQTRARDSSDRHGSSRFKQSKIAAQSIAQWPEVSGQGGRQHLEMRARRTLDSHNERYLSIGSGTVSLTAKTSAGE